MTDTPASYRFDLTPNGGSWTTTNPHGIPLTATPHNQPPTHILVTDIKETGRALRNGYLWAEPTHKAYRHLEPTEDAP